MGAVIEVETTRCMGKTKKEMREVYFYLFPTRTEAQFEADWEQYKQDKAAHIRRLNNGEAICPLQAPTESQKS